jgi:radical SAM superfamily enzyme YgiQ (UPF0313 family)
MIPPVGIASLKSFLEQHDYKVTIGDANTDDAYKAIYYKYFDSLREHVPVEKQGNFFSIGTDVLRNHMMARIFRSDEGEYRQLVKLLINQTYYIEPDDALFQLQDDIIAELFQWMEDYVVDCIERVKPDLLGLSVFKDILPAAVFVFKTVREKYPEIETLMGGSVFSEQLAQGSPDLEFFVGKTKDFIDHIMIGQAEILFLKHLKGELPPDQRVYTRHDIGGETPPFEQLTVPDYSDIDVGKYPYLGFTGSISCPYQCSFCNVVEYFGPFKQKDVSQIAGEMFRLSDQYNRQLFYLSDNMVNTYVTDLCKILSEQDKPLYWSAYLKVDDHGSDIDTAMLWRRGGYYHARLGVDSGSPHVLEMMDKRITPQQSKAMLAGLAYAGIKTTTYWLVGHPGETEEDFQQTLDFIADCRNDIWEAECEYFNYYYVGQSASGQWADMRELVYPDKYRDMLMVQKWGVQGEPSREVIFQRVSRFVQHCRKLGIPNPYSLKELYEADQRWKRLHDNAPPSVVDFQNNGHWIDDRASVKELVLARTTPKDNGDFMF